MSKDEKDAGAFSDNTGQNMDKKRNTEISSPHIPDIQVLHR